MLSAFPSDKSPMRVMTLHSPLFTLENILKENISTVHKEEKQTTFQILHISQEMKRFYTMDILT